MGGFEGGDEAGFWDTQLASQLNDKQTIANSCKTKNIVTYQDNSFIITVFDKNLEAVDTLQTKAFKTENFTLQGVNNDDTVTTMTSAYETLLSVTDDNDIELFFQNHILLANTDVTDDSIDTAAYVAAFLLLAKEACNLVLSTKELKSIGNDVDDSVGVYLDHYYEGSFSLYIL